MQSWSYERLPLKSSAMNCADTRNQDCRSIAGVPGEKP